MKDEIQSRMRCPSIWVPHFRDEDRNGRKRASTSGRENSRQHDKLIIVYQPTVRSSGHVDSISREGGTATHRHDYQEVGVRIVGGGIFFRAFHVDKKCGTQTFPRCHPRNPPPSPAAPRSMTDRVVWCGGRL